MKEVVDKLYEEVSGHLGITPLALQERLTTGEPLIQAYYEWKYNWDINDESTIPF
mgnify:CR=1 FL=1